MLEQAKVIAWDVAKTTGGIVAVNMAGIPASVRQMAGSNKFASYGADGLIYASVSEGVNVLTSDQSKLMSGDYYGYLDDVSFMAGLSLIAGEGKLVEQAFNLVKTVSPLDDNINIALVEGGIISTGRFVGDMVDRNPNIPDALKTFRHITRLIRQ